MGLVPLLAAVLLAVSPVSFVQGHAAGGAYAEPGGSSDALLTSWAVLGLRAAGAASPGSLAYLQSQEPSLQTSNDFAIVALAEQALGDRNEQLLSRLHVQASGQIGETLNSTYWGVLALGHSSRATTRFMLAQQTKAGGFAWSVHGQADSNDTAAALEALRVAGVHGRPVTRAVRFLRTFQRPRRRLRAHAWPGLRRAVHGLGDPGPRGRGRGAAAQLVHLPCEAEAARRELPLFGEVRDDAGLGHVPGAGGAGEEAVPSLRYSTRRPAGLEAEPAVDREHRCVALVVGREQSRHTVP